MNHSIRLALYFAITISIAAQADEPPKKALTPAQQFQALTKEFNAAAYGLHQAKTDDDRAKVAELGAAVSPRCLELAEKYPTDPIALPALTQVVMQEVWLQNNTTHPARRNNDLEAKALAHILRDHLKSDKLGEACWRASGGFSKDGENFLRTVLEKSPHKEVQGTACLRLAMFLNGRLQRLEILQSRPEMANRYEDWFGKEYLEQLRRQDRAQAMKEVESLFERVVEKYSDVKMPYGEAMGPRAKIELNDIRFLSVGKEAPDIDSVDEDGKRFKLSDYRGKVVLLYFWSEY
jgi:hypothetical protein